MNQILKDKVVIVTGAAGGVGVASVKLMVGEGAKVAALDLSEDSVKKNLLAANVDMTNVLPLTCDMTDDESIAAAYCVIKDKLGKVDVLFNNAGILGDGKPILDTDPADLEDLLRINAVGFFKMTIAFGKDMKEQGYGRIINTGSVSGIEADHTAVAYGMSKACVEMLTMGIAVELGEFGVSAVTIAPGPVKTPMWDAAAKDRAASLGITVDEFNAMVCEGIPNRRMAEPEDIAQTALFLANPVSYHITGTHVMCAGGYLTR